MVEESLANDSYIPCHKTLDSQRAVCRGFYEAYGHLSLACRFGHPRLYGTIEVDPDSYE
jgi:hypothetical protein